MVALLSSGALAQVKGIPVDIPGTGVNFFLYRYEGPAPYDKINAIWDNLSEVFAAWVDAGQRTDDLSSKDVHIIIDPNGEVAIYIKDQLIVVVDEYHATINKATPAQLAEKWAVNLRLGVDEFVANNAIEE